MQQISVRIQKVVSLYKNLFIFILQCQWIGLGHKHCCVSVVSIFYPSFCLSFVCRSITFGFVWKNLICSKYYVLCILMQMKLAAVMKKNRWIQLPTRTIGYNIVSFHIQHSALLTTWLCMYRYMTWSMYILYIPRYITNMYPALTSLFIQCICHWVCMNAVRCFLSVVRKYIIEYAGFELRRGYFPLHVLFFQWDEKGVCLRKRWDRCCMRCIVKSYLLTFTRIE
mgnify:CR=1 FL=1